MRSLKLFTAVVWVGAQGMAQQHAPERTITTAPPRQESAVHSQTKEQTEAQAHIASTEANDAQIRAAVEAYRKAWERMNDRMRKMMLSRGGKTPEQYEQMMRQSRGGLGLGMGLAPQAAAPGPAATGASTKDMGAVEKPIDLGVLHTMTTSAEDLSALRDGNLKRVQTGGCPPQINSRIADLKGRLQMYEHVLHPEPVGDAAGIEVSNKAAPVRKGSAAALADEWFKGTTEAKAPGAPKDSASSQLDAVLGGGARETRAGLLSKPEDGAEQRKQAELEIPQIQAELERLSRACVAGH